MKYAATYPRNKISKYEFDEYIISSAEYGWGGIVRFLTNHSPTRVNILLDDSQITKATNWIKDFTSLIEDHPEFNIAFIIPPIEEEIKISKDAAAAAIPYFFQKPITNWDDLYHYLSLSPIAMYIAEDLGFSLPDVSAILHKSNIQIRVYPNVAQSSWLNISDIHKFFIRPEDIDIYEQYVDIFEFWPFHNGESLDTLYKIYAIDKQWNNDLKPLIVGLTISIENECIPPKWAQQRLSCNRRCIKNKHCNYCNNALVAAKLLKYRNLRFKKGADI